MPPVGLPRLHYRPNASEFCEQVSQVPGLSLINLLGLDHGAHRGSWDAEERPRDLWVL